MTITLLSQILFLGALTVVGLLLNRFLKLELTLACLASGFIAGLFLTKINFDTGIRADNLRDIVFFIILPVLIFEAAWHLKPALLRRWLAPIIALATVGVLASCFAMAGIIYFAIDNPQNFPWIAALLTGSILSATDPIAIVTQLRAIKAPDDLAVLFEGESLFNDATAIVLFTLILAMATGEIDTEENYLAYFSAVFFGGLLFGLVFGLIVTILCLLLANSSATTLILTLSAFSSFYIAEHLIHVSGIMTVMVVALVTRFSFKELENDLAKGVSYTWGWLGMFFNNLLFCIMGLVITLGMFQEQWLAMLIAIIAALLARTVAIFSCCLLIRPIKAVSLAWQTLLVWGGLRGAIAIALVLSLPISLPYWWIIQSMVFGVVIFSLLVQGTTNKRLLKTLN
ncbi:MAG: sodium:proton antiporter [Cycloclasticus sp. symbiont of Poecilosclerida sp. M]|nr:MAG: sodium:proton antiporter [Cycloclasticus sp. symbiont of Poecilosclerida sp. M]